MKKAATFIFWFAALVFIAWFTVSYFDIISQNTRPDPNYLPYNLFDILF